MEIILNKEDFANSIKIVEKITAQRAIQPVLSNILIETVSSDRIKLTATDLNLAIEYKTKAEVIEEGSVTLNAKKTAEIVSRLYSSEVKIKTENDSNNVLIKSGKTEFHLISINPEEFPKNNPAAQADEFKTIVLNKNEFSKSLKQILFAVSTQETQAVLTGVSFNVTGNVLELAATDGNRLTRIQKEIQSPIEEQVDFIVPGKTLSEVQRISTMIDDEDITIKFSKNKVLFEFENLSFQSRLIEGSYPKYQQLIPVNNDKKIIADRVELINVIERVSVMVSERTNVVKFNFTQGQLEISADTPDAGSSKDYIDIKYEQEDILTAFNYKYVLDGLKNMDTSEIMIEIADVLAATIFKPVEDKDNYICLIMPVKV